MSIASEFNRNIKIAPSILAADFANFGAECRAIENQGFNETTNRWHGDHLYRHEAGAILSFWLICMIAFNLFHAFFLRNLKPEVRAKSSKQHVARQISSEIHAGLPGAPERPP